MNFMKQFFYVVLNILVYCTLISNEEQVSSFTVWSKVNKEFHGVKQEGSTMHYSTREKMIPDYSQNAHFIQNQFISFISDYIYIKKMVRKQTEIKYEK